MGFVASVDLPAEAIAVRLWKYLWGPIQKMLDLFGALHKMLRTTTLQWTNFPATSGENPLRAAALWDLTATIQWRPSSYMRYGAYATAVKGDLSGFPHCMTTVRLQSRKNGWPWEHGLFRPDPYNPLSRTLYTSVLHPNAWFDPQTRWLKWKLPRCVICYGKNFYYELPWVSSASGRKRAKRSQIPNCAGHSIRYIKRLVGALTITTSWQNLQSFFTRLNWGSCNFDVQRGFETAAFELVLNHKINGNRQKGCAREEKLSGSRDWRSQ